MDNKTAKILSELKKAVVGKDEILLKVYMAVLSGGHILMEDVPGVGKTTLAVAFSKVLGLDNKRIQFTSDSVPSDVIGFSLYSKETGSFIYQPGAAMTNILLADEINRTSSKTQAALLEVMEEGKITVDGITREVPSPFVVIATQNPVGSAGTQPLPASQLDRFMIRLTMGYPDFESQMNILRERHTANPLDSLNSVINAEELLEQRKKVSEIFVSDEIYRYITMIAEATRTHKAVELGLSPRAALALCRLAKACAYIRGRNYVIPADVTAVLKDCCAHRLILNQKARISGVTAKNILSETVKSIPIPGIEVEKK